VTFKLADLRTKEWGRLVGVFVLLFVLGVVTRAGYRCYWPWPDLAYAVADALMIAGLLGFCFEIFATKLLIEKVADDLTEKLVGRGLPQKIQRLILKITQTDLVRSNYVKTYSFTRENAPAGKVFVHISVSFEVRNFGQVAKDYSPIIQNDTFYNPQVTYVEYGFLGESHSFDAAKLNAIADIKPVGVKTIEGLPTVKIEPESDNEKPVCRVRWNFRLTMLEEYTDVTYFGGPTTDCKIFAEQIPEKIEFHSPHGQHEEDSRSWNHSGPFVEGQHVRVVWFKKSQKEVLPKS
jgi:hypothetical protein